MGPGHTTDHVAVAGFFSFVFWKPQQKVMQPEHKKPGSAITDPTISAMTLFQEKNTAAETRRWMSFFERLPSTLQFAILVSGKKLEKQGDGSHLDLCFTHG